MGTIKAWYFSADAWDAAKDAATVMLTELVNEAFELQILNKKC